MGLKSPFWIMNVKSLLAREALILTSELQSGSVHVASHHRVIVMQVRKNNTKDRTRLSPGQTSFIS